MNEWIDATDKKRPRQNALVIVKVNKKKSDTEYAYFIGKYHYGTVSTDNYEFEFPTCCGGGHIEKWKYFEK